MLPIFICEDNNEQKTIITDCIKKYILMENFHMKITMSETDPHTILRHIKNDPKLGIYFLDVDLKTDINGIELAEQIRHYDPRGFIIFITTLAESLQLTFKYKVEALDYIIKDEIEDLGARICECLSNINSKLTSDNINTAKHFAAKISDNRIITIAYDKIMFFETSSTKHKIILNSTEGRYEFYAKLDKICEKLNADFIKCHKSFIVNKKNIKEINFKDKTIHMKDGSVCYSSSRLIKHFRDFP